VHVTGAPLCSRCRDFFSSTRAGFSVIWGLLLKSLVLVDRSQSTYCLQDQGMPQKVIQDDRVASNSMEEHLLFCPTIAEIQQTSSDCALCRVIVEAISSSGEIQGSPNRCITLSLATADGYDFWFGKDRTGRKVSVARGIHQRLDSWKKDRIAWLGISVEHEEGAGSFPEQVSHGLRIYAPEGEVS
jgi:hypothetical protein